MLQAVKWKRVLMIMLWLFITALAAGCAEEQADEQEHRDEEPAEEALEEEEAKEETDYPEKEEYRFEVEYEPAHLWV